MLNFFLYMAGFTFFFLNMILELIIQCLKNIHNIHFKCTYHLKGLRISNVSHEIYCLKNYCLSFCTPKFTSLKICICQQHYYCKGCIAKGRLCMFLYIAMYRQYCNAKAACIYHIAQTRLHCIYICNFTHIQYPLALTELGMHLENEF